MTKRTTIEVVYGSPARTARFSDYGDAQRFAHEMSLLHLRADVFERYGVVGQWRAGEPSPEFAHTVSWL